MVIINLLPIYFTMPAFFHLLLSLLWLYVNAKATEFSPNTSSKDVELHNSMQSIVKLRVFSGCDMTMAIDIGTPARRFNLSLDFLQENTFLFNELIEYSPVSESDPSSYQRKIYEPRIFKANLPHLYILVAKVLSIPVSNAFVERVFSLCNSQWTDTRNSLNVDSVKSLVQVKVNFDFTCPQMFDMLLNNHKLLKEIVGGGKWVSKL